jgi:acetyltransferase
MEKQNLGKLFNPESIAIVGASDKPGKVGTVIAENITNLGYAGAVYYVNQSYEELYGKRCYNSLQEIGKKIDLAIIVVPAQFVNEVVRNGASSAKNFVVISAGFSEIGKEGASREYELLTIAQENELNILGPNCLGFIVPGLKLNASFAGGMPESGNISFISQSGALAVAMMDKAEKESLRFSNIISVGNKMQLSEAVLLEYLENDPATKVIGMYLEGIKEGQSFIETARRVSCKKPIVVLKAGKTEKAQKAISSHTGALAGSDVIMDVAFKKAGIIRAETLDEFFSLLKLISFSDIPQNGNVAIVTNAGGAGVLTTDAFKGKGIMLAEISDTVKGILKQELPRESSLENPIDVLGDAREDRYARVLEALSGEDIGTIVCVLTPQNQTPVNEIADLLCDFKRKIKKNLISVFIGGERIQDAIEKLQASGIPNFDFPEKAIDAIDKYNDWNEIAKSKSEGETIKFDKKRGKYAKGVIESAKARGQKALLFSQAADLMEKYGIKPVEAYDISMGLDVPDSVEYPVAVKIDSDTVLHKTDKQGLILGIKDKEGLENARKIISDNFPGEKIIAQPMRDKHAELILGVTRDSVFGPVIAFGLGGIYTEVFKMVDFLIPPMDEKAIIEAISQSKIAFLFEGVRGQKKCDVVGFARVIKGLMEFVAEAEGVNEFDINPLFVYNDGRPAIAVDIKVIF